jgi:hypothetical protein
MFLAMTATTYLVHPLPARGPGCGVCRLLKLGVFRVRKPEPFQIPHFHTVKEVAEAFKLSEQTIRNIFQDMPGVTKITKGKKLRGKREYTTLRIPDTVIADYLRRNTV